MLSTTNIEKCPHCASENIVKDGFTKGRNQRVLCKECNKSRVLHKKNALPFSFEQIKRAFLERLSLCGVCRIFLISYYQVYKMLNLSFMVMPKFKTWVLAKPASDDVLEFDELCGFCGKKKHKQWLWAALSRNTRQIVAYVIGDRSEKTFRRLIRKIPIEWLKIQSYSDAWKSYSLLLSKGNHNMIGKETGQTNHIERYWATLRARMSRYVRKSLSFSRKLRYHHLVTKLFIMDYNLQCLSTLF